MPGTPPKRLSAGCWLPVLFVVGVGLAGVVKFGLWLTTPKHRLVARWDQTADMRYGNSGVYALSVWERETGLDQIDFTHDSSRHDIAVGRISPAGTLDPPSVRLDYYFVGNRDSGRVSDLIAYRQVEWTADGVTFIDGDRRLFIPASDFTK